MKKKRPDDEWGDAERRHNCLIWTRLRERCEIPHVLVGSGAGGGGSAKPAGCPRQFQFRQFESLHPELKLPRTAGGFRFIFIHFSPR
jgi:hypothetical protein